MVPFIGPILRAPLSKDRNTILQIRGEALASASASFLNVHPSAEPLNVRQRLQIFWTMAFSARPLATISKKKKGGRGKVLNESRPIFSKHLETCPSIKKNPLPPPPPPPPKQKSHGRAPQASDTRYIYMACFIYLFNFIFFFFQSISLWKYFSRHLSQNKGPNNRLKLISFRNSQLVWFR